jgi:acetoin utilization protein AcuB
MLVRDYMTRDPVTIGPDRRVVEAQRLMAEHKISHLPVVGAGRRLLGLVTREALAIKPEQLDSMNFWELADYMARLTIGDVMAPAAELPVITPRATLEEAAEAILASRLAGLPVVEAGLLVGIITETDLLVELRDLLGAIDPGWRVVVRVPDRVGEFRKLVQVIAANEWGLMALGCVRSPRQPGHWDVVAKLRHCEREEILVALNELEGQEVIDIRETSNHKR